MNIAVRYQSRGGNTMAVAEAIARAAGVKAEPVSVPLTEPVDLLFVGGGVYASKPHKSLQRFLAALDPAGVKTVAPFCTGGRMSVAEQIAEAARARGVAVTQDSLTILLGAKNYYLFGERKTLTLTGEQLAAVEAFVEKVR